MNIGALSSWAGAVVSILTVGGGAIRSWRRRPLVDWILTGAMDSPTELTQTWLQGEVTVANIGDGDAHRVAVHIGPRFPDRSQILERRPLLKPGDSITTRIGAADTNYDNTAIWVTWTDPPIRRHREQTSRHMLLAEHITENPRVRVHIDNREAVREWVANDPQIKEFFRGAREQVLQKQASESTDSEIEVTPGDGYEGSTPTPEEPPATPRDNG